VPLQLIPFAHQWSNLGYLAELLKPSPPTTHNGYNPPTVRQKKKVKYEWTSNGGCGRNEGGPDIAGYTVTLAVILAIVAGMVKLVRSSANNGFSASASSIQ
jgi:hypothetical protein